MTRRWAFACRILATVSLAACVENKESIGPDGRAQLARYVALGTSVSMGVQSAGVLYATQQQSWPAQLARLANVPFTLPLIAAPGCDAPLAAPLQLQQRYGRPASVVTPVCSALLSGVTLPASDVAINTARTSDALRVTPESAAVRDSAYLGKLYRRVLRPGQTQLTAAIAQKPTFVSVELGSNELLGAALSGLFVPNVTYVTYDVWQPQYDSIVTQLKATGARGVLVGLPVDLTKFPSFRLGSEIYAERTTLAALNIAVAANCQNSPNYIFVTSKLATALTIAATRPPTNPYSLSCADTVGQDNIVTPANAATLQAQVDQMNAHIKQLADQNGFACFRLEALYGVARPETFSIASVLSTDTPFGPLISLDGVHPSGRGSTTLALAAVRAINAKYGLGIPEPAGIVPIAAGAAC
ncbi:MAG: hypothetical protein WKG32_11440 [Gemmatimonadaceae bacterium]